MARQLTTHMLGGEKGAAVAASDKKPTAGFSTLELSTLSRIIPYATDAGMSRQVVALLLPFLHKETKDVPERNKKAILETIAHSVALFGGGVKHYTSLSRLFDKLWSTTTRSLLAAVFVAIGKEDAAYEEVGGLAVQLTAMDSGSLRDDAFDYDARLDAIMAIADTHAMEMTTQQLMPLIHTLVFCARSDDATLRSQALHGLTKLVERAAADGGTGFDGIVGDIIFPAVKKGLKGFVAAVRSGFLLLLELLTKMFPDHAWFSSLAKLRDAEDDERDFFGNIKHIQIHRRVKAVHQLTAATKAGELSEETLVTLIHPLVAHFIFEATKESEHNLVTATVDFIGAMTGELGWSRYSNTLQKYLSLMKEKPQLTKVLLRCVLKVIDCFHFSTVVTPDAAAAANAAAAEKERAKAAEDAASDNEIRLFVGQIPRSYAASDVRPIFEPFGEVVDVIVLNDKGCCFVVLDSHAAGRAAITALHELKVLPGMNAPMQVKVADRSKKANAPAVVENDVFVEANIAKAMTEKFLPTM